MISGAQTPRLSHRPDFLENVRAYFLTRHARHSLNGQNVPRGHLLFKPLAHGALRHAAFGRYPRNEAGGLSANRVKFVHEANISHTDIRLQEEYKPACMAVNIPAAYDPGLSGIFGNGNVGANTVKVRTHRPLY